MTFTGRSFWPLDPRPEDIDIRDIAHHLSLLNRFTGATKKGVSVAEHSCHVSDILPAPLKLWGLLHDSPEGYGIGDLSRPVKIQPGLAEYRAIEKRIMRVVCERFGLVWPEPPEVKYADNAVGKAERFAQMPPFPDGAVDFDAEPADVRIACWPASWAEDEFLRRFRKLTAVEVAA